MSSLYIVFACLRRQASRNEAIHVSPNPSILPTVEVPQPRVYFDFAVGVVE